MGLDAVEILMEVEEAFDIQIEDSGAEQMLTPHDLVEAVMRKVAKADSTGCLTQRSFNLLRKTLLHHLPLKRSDIHPRVLMSDLVPKPERIEIIRKIVADLKTDRFPDLVRPSVLVACLYSVSIAAGIFTIGAILKYHPSSSTGLMLLAGTSSGGCVGVICYLATLRYCTEFPPLVKTVGDLARWIMVHRKNGIHAWPRKWTREQVAARIREIIVDKLECGDRYRENASFVKELGLS